VSIDTDACSESDQLAHQLQVCLAASCQQQLKPGAYNFSIPGVGIITRYYFFLELLLQALI
jgi:hypothetical protein